ncbi:PTAC2 [Symbiodinium natans]|uniref:PTAC2 protein n=1 Tax=Symbiodinium natans TaxID=878477 RepID=A0A812IFH7_9DINO|nr:PTAC2 [Symbiodinium natans]
MRPSLRRSFRVRRPQAAGQSRRFTSRAILLADVRDRSKRRPAVVDAVENLLRQSPLRDAEEAAICAAALSRRKLWERGLSMLSEGHFLTGTKGLNAAVKTCRSASQWELALWLALSAHKQTERDGLTYSMVLSACSEGSVWELAIRLWLEARQEGLGSYGHVASAAIAACGKGKQWQQAIALLCSIEQPDAAVFAAAIDACRRAGRWQEALAVLESFRPLGAPPPEGIGAAVSALAYNTRWMQALLLFHEEFLQGPCLEGTGPGMRGFTGALQACAEGSNWQVALSLLEQMAARKLAPDKRCFDIALRAHKQARHGGQPQAAPRRR